MARSKKSMEAVVDEAGPRDITLSRLPANLSIPETVVEEYVAAGFKVSEVEGYERDVMAVKEGMAQSVYGFIAAGERLAAMQLRTGHGSWQHLLDRCGLVPRSAQRAIAAYNVVQQYRQLGDVLHSFAPSTLALLGERKDLTDDGLDAIIRVAATGEVTQEEALDMVREHAPAKETKPRNEKSYFKAMTEAQAAPYVEDVVNYASMVAGKMLGAGADMAHMGKSSLVKRYIAAIAKADPEDLTPLQIALRGLLFAGAILDNPRPEGEDGPATDVTPAS